MIVDSASLYHLQEVEGNIPAYSEMNGGSREIDWVPLMIVSQTGDNGNFDKTGFSGNAIKFLAASAIEYLNEQFAPVDIQFFQLGDVHSTDFTNAWVNPSFSGQALIYHPNALMIYVDDRSNVKGIAIFPWNTASLNNITTLQPTSLNTSSDLNTFPHELGHIYGLLHTHEFENGYELVIREEDLTKLNSTPNCETSGDKCCDTDADCFWTGAPNNPSNPYPGCSVGTLQCGIINQLRIGDYTGSFADANGDALINEDNRVRNIMSYFQCVDTFTDEQYGRIYQYHLSHRKSQLTATAINLKDFVEFEGTSKKMKNVRVNLTYPDVLGELNFTRNFTGILGSFETQMLDENIQADVIQGSGSVYAYFDNDPSDPNLPLKLFQGFNDFAYNQWADSLDIFDIIAIQKYVGYPNLPYAENTLANGYKKLAADVNDDGIISEIDYQLIQQLLSGSITKFTEFTQPYRFVPEFISQGSNGFLSSPFNLTINNQPIPKADYTKPDFEYEITDGLDESSGFDGVKIGNVRHTPYTVAPPNFVMNNMTSDPVLLSGEPYEITVVISGEDIGAAQFELLLANGAVDSQSIATNTGVPGLIRPNMKSDEWGESLRSVWSYLPAALDSAELFHFTFTPTITTPFLDSFFILQNGSLNPLLLDSSGVMTAQNGQIQLFVEHASTLRSGKASNNATHGDLDVFIMPNPVRDMMTSAILFNTIHKDKARNLSCRLVDFHGRVVDQQNVVTNQDWIELVWPMGFLADGLYCLVIESGEQLFSYPILKQ
ncbi:MAG: hypothetical protein KDC19_10395 [Saprospiraceae bacterium]|nr:hypothetical protein [Saprospiraceae bacterium]